MFMDSLITYLRLDGRKDMQPVKSVWLICIQSLKPMSHIPWREKIRGIKQTNTTSDNPIFMHIQWKLNLTFWLGD